MLPPPEPKRHPFIQALWEHFSEIRDDVDDPVNYGLLHIELGMFAQRSLEAFRSGDLDTVRRYFDFVETGFDGADDALINALHVSFAEDFAWGSPHDKTARSLMPERLGEAFDVMTAWPKPVASARYPVKASGSDAARSASTPYPEAPRR